jgi:16S rRNA (guanine527-N7)-methyltransferase
VSSSSCGASGSGVELIAPHFELSSLQRDQFAALGPLYFEWNAKINVISRKDLVPGQALDPSHDLNIFYTRHVLHSLAIALLNGGAPSVGIPGHSTPAFDEAERVLDVGTGGGFPGIPLAILFPSTSFTLCDSIGKKIRVVEAVVRKLGLENVDPVWARAEDLRDPSGQPALFDTVVSRAVARMPVFLDWIRGTRATRVLYLKGGDLREELSQLGHNVSHVEQQPLSTCFNLSDFPVFEDKCVVRVALSH